MFRSALLGLIVALILLGGPSAARACSMRRMSIFEQADEAAVIAIGQRLRGKGIRASEVLIGTTRQGVVDIDADPRGACTPAMTRGVDALVFVDVQHGLVAHYQSWIEQPDARLLQALRRYVNAPDDRARRALLVELATSGNDQLASDAAYHLSNRPDLLRGTTDEERGRLIGALSRAHESHLHDLAWVVARLHDVAGAAALVAALDRLGPTDYVEQIAIPLEVLTNHVQPLDRVTGTASEGERFNAWRSRRDLQEVGAAIAGARMESAVSVTHEHWRLWLLRNEALDGDALYRLGFRERGLTMPAPDDPAALAAAVRRGPDGVTRVVAMDRCEQHWGRSLHHFPSYANGTALHFWATMAAACESGVPVR